MQNYKIHEFTLETKTIDVSDTSANPVESKCYKHFKDILNLNLPITGWEVDSDGKRLGLFFHDKDAISKMVAFLKIEDQDIEMLGVFYNLKGVKTIRIIKKLKDSKEFDNLGINWVSYNQDTPEKVSYELRATLDIAKFISSEEIEAIRLQILGAQKLSHIKIQDGKLVKVYFIEYYDKVD